MKSFAFRLTIASLGMAMTASSAIIYSENFGSLVNQAPLVATNGDASTSFDANATIGDTNATGDAASGGIYASTGATSGLSTRNGIRGYTTVAHANFTTGSGSVGQLHTHTSGGFGVLSTGPITTVNLVANQPTPIVLTGPAAGDIIRVTFDMYVQAVRTTGTDNLAVNWNLKDSAFTVITKNDTWDDYKNASVGDVIAVQKDLVITAAMISAGLHSIGPQFTFGNAPGQIAYNTAFAQIDNYKIEHIAIPEPSSLALIGLGMLGLSVRRRR